MKRLSVLSIALFGLSVSIAFCDSPEDAKNANETLPQAPSIALFARSILIYVSELNHDTPPPTQDLERIQKAFKVLDHFPNWHQILVEGGITALSPLMADFPNWKLVPEREISMADDLSPEEKDGLMKLPGALGVVVHPGKVFVYFSSSVLAEQAAKIGPAEIHGGWKVFYLMGRRNPSN